MYTKYLCIYCLHWKYYMRKTKIYVFLWKTILVWIEKWIQLFKLEIKKYVWVWNGVFFCTVEICRNPLLKRKIFPGNFKKIASEG